MNIKFGLKLWSTNTDLINQAIQLIDEKIFNYIELLVIPDTQISPFMIDVPYIIHIPHHRHGVNIGDIRKKEYSLQKINESIQWADALNARYLILHAGDGYMEDAADLLRGIEDSRLLIENMPKVGLNDEKMIGYSPMQIRELIGDSDRSLCLDFGHAIKAAFSQKIDYHKYIKEFLEFNPKVFHICDGKLADEKDEHSNIGEGEYDFSYLLGCIKNNMFKNTTLETPREKKDTVDNDLTNLNILKLYA